MPRRLMFLVAFAGQVVLSACALPASAAQLEIHYAPTEKCASFGMSASQESTSQTIVAPQVLLGNHLMALKLPTFAREYEKVALESAQDRADYPRYLLRLCDLEHIDREWRNVERRIRLARFTQIKSLDTFDFAAQPSLNKPLVLGLARCEWMEKRQNCIALGPSGTGKTYVALALWLAACQKGFSVAFPSAASEDADAIPLRNARSAELIERFYVGPI